MEEHLKNSDIYLINLNTLEEKGTDIKISTDLKSVLAEYKDVFPEKLPAGLPPTRFAEPVVRPLKRLPLWNWRN